VYHNELDVIHRLFATWFAIDSGPIRAMKRNLDFDFPEHVNRRQLLKGTLGVAVSAAGISAISGITAAHFPTTIEIVITPDSEDNRIDPSSEELITVAVLTTTYQTEAGEQTTFDPTEEPVRYRFGTPDTLESGGGARPVGDGQIRDVNGDGKADLVLQFPVEETGFSGDEMMGRLLWERDKSGEHGLAGEAPVTIVMKSEDHEQETDGKQDGKQKDDNGKTDNTKEDESEQENKKKNNQQEETEKEDKQEDDGKQESEPEGDVPC
jgi:hypothetical protein